MDRSSFSWIVLSVSLLFLAAAGAAVSGLQNWAKYGVAADQLLESAQWKPAAPALRAISSTVTESPAEPKEPSLINVKNSTPGLSGFQPSPTKAAPQSVRHQEAELFPAEKTAKNAPAASTEPAAVEPVVVMYDHELVIEFPDAVASPQNIKRAVARLLLSREPFREALLSSEPLRFREQPYLYQRVLDHNQRPIRYPAHAYRYVDYLLDSNAAETLQDEEGRFLAITIPLHRVDYPQPVREYKPWVDQYAAQFDVAPELVFAIMETESGFRPHAVSRSNALGLMQLKPHAAGRDVYRYVDAKKGMPGKQELFDEETNIRMGTAYLGLLKHEYLAQVRNDRNRELLAISAYNGGLSTVTKLFGKTPQKALTRINQLHPRQVYRKLRYEHQSDETRRYLDKVLQAKEKYHAILHA